MKKYNVSINDRKFIVNAQDELEAIKKVKDSLRKSKINQQDANPSKEDFYQINSKRFNKIKENIKLGKLTKESALQYVEKMWGSKEPGSASYLKNWIKEDIKDSSTKSTAKDELSNDKLVLFAKAAERAQNDSELKKIIYDVMNYDRTLFNKLLDAYNRDYYDFNHKRHAISTIFTLAIRP